MKLCKTCVYGTEYELDKPCIVYRADCRYYRKVGEDMTREQAIITLKVVDENASCDDCLYYNQMEDCPDNEDCIIRQALEMSIEALAQEPGAGEMLICPDCGLEVHSDFKTCPRCGARMAESEEI